MTTDTSTALNERADRLARSQRPLLVEPPATTPRPAGTAKVKMIVAFDGSPAAIGALTLAARLAGSAGSKLVVACVFPPEWAVRIPFDPRAERINYDDYRMVVRQDAQAVLGEAQAMLPPDLAVTYRALECESPARGLSRLVHSERGDLLVLGATRRGPLGRRLHRSLARDLLRDPPCAVAVVARDPRDPPRSSGEPMRPARGRPSSSEILTTFLRDPRKGGI